VKPLNVEVSMANGQAEIRTRYLPYTNLFHYPYTKQVSQRCWNFGFC